MSWASLIPQLWLRICLQCGRPGFDPWVGKIPWRRAWQPIPVFWPGKFHGLYRPWGRKESEQLTLSNDIYGIPLDVLVLIFLNILHFYVQTFPLWLISNLPAQSQMTSQVANNLIVSFRELGRQGRGGRDHGRKFPKKFIILAPGWWGIDVGQTKPTDAPYWE